MAKHLHVCEFSPSGKLFALINADGKLLIWDTETSVLNQTFTLSTNINANCTALQWITGGKAGGKGKRKSLETGTTQLIALGTSVGQIEIYSYGTGKIEYTLKGSGHNGPVSSIYYNNKDTIFTCGLDANIIQWSISKCAQQTTIKLKNEVLYSVLQIPSTQNLVLSGRSLIVYNFEQQEEIHKFTGHASAISVVKHFIVNGQDYLVTGSKADRILSMWNLQTDDDSGVNKNAMASFLMENICVSLSCEVVDDSLLKIAAVTRSGVVHYFIEEFSQLRRDKPIKPKATLEIVSNSKKAIEAIPAIVTSIKFAVSGEDELLVGYGNREFLRFENFSIVPKRKNQIEIRTDPRKLSVAPQEEKKFGMMTPIVQTDQIEYSTGTSSVRKGLKSTELPMETRLENLSVDTTNGPTSAKNMVQLLIQGLHSQDAKILRLVFTCKDDEMIHVTLQKLPPMYIASLVNQLSSLMSKKTSNVRIGVKWMRHLLQSNSSQLMALGKDDLFEKFGPSMGLIEHRINNLMALSRVRGRLDLLVNQIKGKNTDDDAGLDTSKMLVYDDQDSSVEANDDGAAGSSSDEQWEDSDDGEKDDDDDAMDVNEVDN